MISDQQLGELHASALLTAQLAVCLHVGWSFAAFPKFRPPGATFMRIFAHRYCRKLNKSKCKG